MRGRRRVIKLREVIDRDLAQAIKETNGKFVTISILHRPDGGIEPEFEMCMDNLQAFSFRQGVRFSKARRAATDCERGRYLAIEKDFIGDWFLCIDTDQVFPADTLIRLMSHDVPIVGTLVTSKRPPHQVVTAYGNEKVGFESLLDWPNNALIEVDVTGFGCILIKREVFEKFPEGNPFLKIFCEDLNDNLGEDWSFCLRARKLGFPIYVDTSIPIGHLGKYNYTIGDYELYKDVCIENSKHLPFYGQCVNPKIIQRLEIHPKMRNLLVTPDSKLSVPKNKKLILMGEDAR